MSEVPGQSGRALPERVRRGWAISEHRDTFKAIDDRVIAPSSGSGQRNTPRSALHIQAAAVRRAIPLLYCVRVRPDRGENEFVLMFECRNGNQVSEKARLTLHYFNR